VFLIDACRAIELPSELRQAIADVVLDAWVSQRQCATAIGSNA
jgi:hypothetical protein